MADEPDKAGNSPPPCDPPAADSPVAAADDDDGEWEEEPTKDKPQQLEHEPPLRPTFMPSGYIWILDIFMDLSAECLSRIESILRDHLWHGRIEAMTIDQESIPKAKWSCQSFFQHVMETGRTPENTPVILPAASANLVIIPPEESSSMLGPIDEDMVKVLEKVAPYVALMVKGVMEYPLSTTDRVTCDQIVEWLDKNWIGGLHRSNSILNNMASLMRHPKFRTGGNLPTNKKPST